MNILILSCNTGEGHNAAGRAILHELQRRHIPCEMADALHFAGDRVSRRISSSYTAITTRAPTVFRAMYRAGDFISSSRHKSPVICSIACIRAQFWIISVRTVSPAWSCRICSPRKR